MSEDNEVCHGTMTVRAKSDSKKILFMIKDIKCYHFCHFQWLQDYLPSTLAPNMAWY